MKLSRSRQVENPGLLNTVIFAIIKVPFCCACPSVASFFHRRPICRIRNFSEDSPICRARNCSEDSPICRIRDFSEDSPICRTRDFWGGCPICRTRDFPLDVPAKTDERSLARRIAVRNLWGKLLFGFYFSKTDRAREQNNRDASRPDTFKKHLSFSFRLNKILYWTCISIKA